MKNSEIEEIVQRVRKEIQNKGFDDKMPSFDQVPVFPETAGIEINDEYSNIKRIIEETKYVPLETDDGKGITKIIKKAIRKITNFIIAPYAEKQNIYNQNTAMAIDSLIKFIKEQNSLLEEYDQSIEDLKKLLEEK